MKTHQLMKRKVHWHITRMF